MKATKVAYIGALTIFQALGTSAKHSHEILGALERRHRHHAREAHPSPTEAGLVQEQPKLRKRGQCEFPTDAGLYAVTPNEQNAGWAMSPDQPCLPNSYCPIACPPGQVMAQWDPDATSYPSMAGGLYCDADGNIQKPFPDRPYCMDGSSNIGVTDKTGEGVAFCQTVLPGSESMLIPTPVNSWTQLAVPQPNYWLGTSAHYYINAPGVSIEDGCKWGVISQPVGNWAPFVGGGNTDHNGNTFIKLGWNPEYTDPSCPSSNTVPDFSVTIECDGECNGLPCHFDPSQNGVNELVGSQADGAGGASFCVVTVPQGVTANYVVSKNGGGGGSGSGSASSSASSGGSSPSPSPSPSPSSSSKPSPSSVPKPSSAPSPSSASPSISSAQDSVSDLSSTITAPGSAAASSSSTNPQYSWSPHQMLQNYTIPGPTASGSGSSAGNTANPTATGDSGSSGSLPIPSATPTGGAYHMRVGRAAAALAIVSAIMALLL